jgi:two-component system nitrogen regulation sensor histidine kinase GlnL
VHTTLLAFALYSAALIAALWHRPSTVLRLNMPVLAADLLFAFCLIRWTGGADSAVFLALVLICGVQAYYHGMARGLGVAVISGAGYLAVVWPTMEPSDRPHVAIHLLILVGTAVGIGILEQVERRERDAVSTLTGQVQAREQFIANVVESLSEGLVVLDLEGRVLTWNRSMRDRYGVEADEVRGRPFIECFPSYRREGLAEPLGRLLRGEIPSFVLEAVEHQTLRRGRAIQNIKGSLLREQGRAAGAALLVEDITHRVALERSARQSEKLAALGTLAAGIAHELNNPIGIISSRIEIMLLDAEAAPLPLEVADDLRVLHRHAQRVARIAQGLLSFARQSSGERSAVDVNDLVDDTLLLFEKQTIKEGIAVKRALAPGLPPVWADGNALQQVLLNLLTNARDVLEAGGEIAVETSFTSGHPSAVRLTVRDSGPGIPPDVLPRVFDPFFTTKPGGTGLGLSISYGIVRDHHGALDVESQPGHGTAFTVTLRPVGAEVTA